MTKFRIIVKAVFSFICVTTELLCTNETAYWSHPFWDFTKTVWQNCYEITRDEIELG